MNSPSPFLTWLDNHPESYVWLAGTVILAATVLALYSWGWAKPGAGPRSDWKWGLVLLAVLAAGRWPSMMIPRELNPDESQFFAGAHALVSDPVFWRSVAGDTSGPLNYFSLWPAGWLAGWDSYAGMRITALLLLGASLTLVHQSLAAIYPARAVRLATLSAAVLEGLTNSVDLLHYSSELMPLLWLSGASWAALRRWTGRGGAGWCALGGFALGAVTMSKLQAAPLALGAGLCWLAGEWRDRTPGAARRLTYLIGGAVLPVVFFVIPVIIADQWDNFITCCFRSNLVYVAVGESSFSRLLSEMFAKSLGEDSLLHLWLPGTIAWCALAFLLKPAVERTTRTFTLFALAATVVSVACVLWPGRPFLHYWQLVVPPVTLLLGALLGNLALATQAGPTKTTRWLMAGCALGLLGVLGQHRLQKPNFFVGAFTYFAANPRTPIADRVARHARPGEAVAIWGWSNYIHVETGLRQGTREPHIARALFPWPLQAQFRERFLVDMLVTRPELFVDSVGQCSCFFNSPAFKHQQNFPELAAAVRAGYVLVDEVDGAQVYRRRDLVTP